MALFQELWIGDGIWGVVKDSCILRRLRRGAIICIFGVYTDMSTRWNDDSSIAVGDAHHLQKALPIVARGF
jgi:hypothetical protein